MTPADKRREFFAERQRSAARALRAYNKEAWRTHPHGVRWAETPYWIVRRLNRSGVQFHAKDLTR